MGCHEHLPRVNLCGLSLCVDAEIVTWKQQAAERKIMCWEVACESLSGSGKIWRFLVLVNPQEQINSGHQEPVQGYQHMPAPTMVIQHRTYWGRQWLLRAAWRSTGPRGTCGAPTWSSQSLSMTLCFWANHQDWPPNGCSSWVARSDRNRVSGCLNAPLSAVSDNSLMLLVVKFINGVLIDVDCDVCWPVLVPYAESFQEDYHLKMILWLSALEPPT